MLFLGVAQHTEREQRYNIYVTRESHSPQHLLRAIAVPPEYPHPRVLSVGEVEAARAVDERFRRGVYRHYRGGFYQALGVAADESLVVYVSLTGAHMPGPRLRVRPLAMWEEMVEVGCDGGLDHVCGPGCERKVPRFEYVGDEIPEAMRPKEGT